MFSLVGAGHQHGLACEAYRAIDGKTARRSHERAEGQAAIQMVSAWPSASHLVLGQRHVQEHSNEKTALPRLLEQLELAGCIVSIDAMGCHAKIARQIKEQDGEYVLALKANQGTLYQDVVDLFADALSTPGADWLHDYHRTEDQGHGRRERRQYWTIADPEVIAYAQRFMAPTRVNNCVTTSFTCAASTARNTLL
jgi:predicted transposase YbfD/YdcC